MREEGDGTVTAVTADLISRARAGDGDAFRELTEPHRRELQVHCYRANGQPAFGAYLSAPAGIRHGTGLYVLTLTGDRICAMTRFDNSVLPWFGLPRSLPSR